MLPPPLNKFLLFAALFFSWKRSDEAKRPQRLARNKWKRLEIRHRKKNAHEEASSRNKEKTDNRRKINCLLHKNKQHFLKFALFVIKDAKNHRNRLIRSYQKTRFKNIPNVHINRFGSPEELDEHTKLSITVFIALYHAAVESVLLTSFFLFIRMVMMQRKLPRTARREWRPSSSLRGNRKPQMIYTWVGKLISF